MIAATERWAELERKRRGYLPEMPGRSDGVTHHLAEGKITVRQLIAKAAARARKGDARFAAQLVRALRKLWSLSDHALCVMFWDCAGVQGTELRMWLEEVQD